MVKKYMIYLEQVNNSMNKLHKSLEPARNGIENIMVKIIEACNQSDSIYDDLNFAISNLEDYKYINIERYLPEPGMKRHRFIKNLELIFPIGFYQYHAGNYLGTTTFIWKIPIEVNDRTETQNAQTLLSIQDLIPHYFTRQMRKNMLERYSLVAKVTPVLLRNLYHDLTGDATIAPNNITKELDERLRWMLTLQDPNITVDLRINNGFKGTSFDIFWEEVDSYFNENTPAVDDRRHGSTLYIPIVLSIRDLRESIISRLKTRLGNPLPSENNIPSDEWIRVQFTTKNTLAHSEINYTGRFNIRYKVQARLLRKDHPDSHYFQARLLRKDHPDSHYCAGYFRYLREFAIKYRKFTVFICADDKHKVAIGEEVATSTGVRNRKSLIPDNTILAASDHDFTKLSLTPSVILLCKIPASISESFYYGKVYTSYKNTVFEPSSGIRHSTEFFSTLSDHYLNSTEIPPIDVYKRQHSTEFFSTLSDHYLNSTEIPPIMCLYTDGGPDHRTTYGSVQVSLLCLFIRGNFDMLIAMRTAPAQSWTNPAERIMSILNLGLQGVALLRDQMSSEMEDLFSRKNTLEEIRLVAKNNSQLESELRNSIKSIQQLLNRRTERLVLDNENFICKSPADDEEIARFFESIISIDSTLRCDETTQSILRQHSDLQNFIQTHCQIRTYSFQIKKCGNIECEICTMPRTLQEVFESLNFLPDPTPAAHDSDHYANFSMVYNKPTTDEHQPSKKIAATGTERGQSGLYINNKVREFITCNECSKVRCLFSGRQLTEQDGLEIQHAIENWPYTCGSTVFPQDHNLFDKVFVREKICCKTPMEFTYYSCRKVHSDRCYHCGSTDDLQDKPDSLMEKYKSILSLCAGCQDKGLDFFCRMPIQTKKRKHNQ
ncbi:hypothetical protein GLOIN_2v1882875 [Rhizophagus irregularis DAOM 181602=DAOM 197198]|uniref:Uncharacterized protein n=1 Tax=Rhizophagus irregularis (strain DAOM 181602 / DAOM 197198 / MUCL 43194) TaxID=747089 RepID=A0A2P4PAN9_RHIID|nr:hypothetical protein GLOIN_2v1882875 [Rhizophagus irregularis DAOM 181602=DAOM 197198]POG62444.1 hypothetical protein GLOIN_2v1882875 [Rhizophagus irregularis DAOM 181602=DAOM 197198]|eukprot:XP_025169310.1 hypothetical protein GLOIN_2v1882875 [Rhizophagus irregularis DAOM 181602=DAOM 197198]